ncbi:hypothetical protein PGIN_84-3_01590 [Porphyromonas gingivalis]|nr:hypothetical protein PGIN_84-3_01590 [Porphyromonas gingivalis]
MYQISKDFPVGLGFEAQPGGKGNFIIPDSYPPSFKQ